MRVWCIIYLCFYIKRVLSHLRRPSMNHLAIIYTSYFYIPNYNLMVQSPPDESSSESSEDEWYLIENVMARKKNIADAVTTRPIIDDKVTHSVDDDFIMI